MLGSAESRFTPILQRGDIPEPQHGQALLTWAVDVHVDGFLVAFRLQEQQLSDHQAGDIVVNLQVGRAELSPD